MPRASGQPRLQSGTLSSNTNREREKNNSTTQLSVFLMCEHVEREALPASDDMFSSQFLDSRGIEEFACLQQPEVHFILAEAHSPWKMKVFH